MKRKPTAPKALKDPQPKLGRLPSFNCELPLVANQSATRRLFVRLDCARMVYNACLGEALKRLRGRRESKAWCEARQLPRGPRGSETAKKRTAAFRAADEQAGFREYDLHAYSVQFSHSWLGEHLDSNTVQKIASRAWIAVQQYALGKKGKPRFKGKGQFDSVEGKTNRQGILWRDQMVKWNGLELAAIVEETDPAIAHALHCPVKFVRIVRRKLGCRVRFYVQLVCAGKPYPKHALGQGTTGLDVGPTNLAVVSETTAVLVPFCAELENRQAEKRQIQRKLDRQRRANNPDNFNPDGTIKPGKKIWHDSHRYLATRDKLAELQRQQAAQRKSLHGHQANQLIAGANVIKTEKVSYRAFQRLYGKSVGFRAPGMFMEVLRRKAANAGAEFDEFPTATTRLSQVCLCGVLEKKTLSERWHVCDCGVGPVQRDLFSAWLARFVVNGRLDVDRARRAWSGEDDMRLRAASSAIQPAMGQGQPKPNPAPTQVGRGRSRSPAQSGTNVSEAGHGAPSAVTRKLASQPEPPRFGAGE
jgi:transposase